MDNDARGSAVVYEAVADALRQGIRDGTYQPGDPLPSMRKLAKVFGVSVDCVRDAFQMLLREGVVVTDGTNPMRVPPKVEREVVVLPEGAVARVRMPSSEEREKLDLDPVVGVPVFVISRPGEPDALYAADRVAVQAAGRESQASA